MDSAVVLFLSLVIVAVASLTGLAYLMGVAEEKRKARELPQWFRAAETGGGLSRSWGASPVGTFSITQRRLTVDEYRAERFEPFRQPFYLEQVLDDAFLATHEVDHVIVLDLAGELAGSKAFDNPCMKCVSELVTHDERTIAVNLTNLTGVDSAGLGDLIRAYTTVRRQGGLMAVVNAPQGFKDLMAIIK